MLPLTLILGMFFWAVLTGVKYWYYKKLEINYTHKIDEKVLDELRRPSKKVLERMRKRAQERGEEFGNETERDFHSFRDANGKRKENQNETANMESSGYQKRPLTLFEEIDLRRSKANKPKQDSSKYDRKMFDDPLSRLHRDLQKMRRESSSKNKNTSSEKMK